MAAFNRTLLQLVKIASPRPLHRLTAWRRCNVQDLSSIRQFSTSEDYVPAKKNDEEFSILKENIPPKELLFQSVRSATTADAVLKSIESHPDGLNPNNCLLALRNLFTLHKNNLTSLSKEDVITDRNFELICKVVKNGLRMMTVNNQIEILKVLIYFGIPATSIMIQSVLHLLKKQVNDLNISEVIFLHTLCGRSKGDSNIKSLEIALPLVFEANLKLKLDRDSFSHVAEALEFATRYKVSEAAFDDLVTTASKLDVRGFREAYQVARACAKIRYSHPLKAKLSSDALNIIVDNFENISSENAAVLLDSLSSQIKKNPDMYHERFFDACVNKVIAERSSIYKALVCAKRLMNSGNWNKALLNYMCDELISNPAEFKSHVWLSAPFVFVDIVSSSGYKPEKWDEAIPVLMEVLASVPENKFDYNWIQIACQLGRMEVFSDQLLNHVFDERFLKDVTHKKFNTFDLIQIQSLYQAVTLFYPNYSGPIPTNVQLKLALENNIKHIKELPLKKDLESGLGGSQYVLDKAVTKLDFLVDHAVAIRKGGYPVALNQNKEDSEVVNYIDNIELPPDSELLLILYMPKSFDSSFPDTFKFRGQIILKSLEALGYKTLVVRAADWANLAEQERIAFLMQKIKEKMENQYTNLL